MEKIGSSDNSIAEIPFIDTENKAEAAKVISQLVNGLKEDEELTIGKKKKDTPKSRPAFIFVGIGNEDKQKKGTKSMDYTRELLNMTSPEGFMFQLLMDGRINPTEEDLGADYNLACQKIKPGKHTFLRSNHTHIKNSLLSRTQKKYIADAYKILRSKDLVVRTKREYYIINPRLVISGEFWNIDEKFYIEAVEESKVKAEKLKAKKAKDTTPKVTPPPIADLKSN